MRADAPFDPLSTQLDRPAPKPSRWVDLTARAVPLLLLPCCLWRLALAFGVPVGFHGALARTYEGPGWVTVYVLVLTVLSEGLAVLASGLVRPWGEVFPRWVPWRGGKPVPTAAAGAIALLGAAAVTYLAVSTALRWTGPHFLGNPGAPHGLAAAVMTAAYAPLLAWGPLLGVVAIDYLRRHRKPNHHQEASDA